MSTRKIWRKCGKQSEKHVADKPIEVKANTKIKHKLKKKDENKQKCSAGCFVTKYLYEADHVVHAEIGPSVTLAPNPFKIKNILRYKLSQKLGRDIISVIDTFIWSCDCGILGYQDAGKYSNIVKEVYLLKNQFDNQNCHIMTISHIEDGIYIGYTIKGRSTMYLSAVGEKIVDSNLLTNMRIYDLFTPKHVIDIHLLPSNILNTEYVAWYNDRSYKVGFMRFAFIDNTQLKTRVKLSYYDLMTHTYCHDKSCCARCNHTNVNTKLGNDMFSHIITLIKTRSINDIVKNNTEMLNNQEVILLHDLRRMIVDSIRQKVKGKQNKFITVEELMIRGLLEASSIYWHERSLLRCKESIPKLHVLLAIVAIMTLGLSIGFFLVKSVTEEVVLSRSIDDYDMNQILLGRRALLIKGFRLRLRYTDMTPTTLSSALNIFDAEISNINWFSDKLFKDTEK